MVLLMVAEGWGDWRPSHEMVLLMVAGGWGDWGPSFYHEMVLLMIAEAWGDWRPSHEMVLLMVPEGWGDWKPSFYHELALVLPLWNSRHSPRAPPLSIYLGRSMTPTFSQERSPQLMEECETSGEEERRKREVLTTLPHTMNQLNSNFWVVSEGTYM